MSGLVRVLVHHLTEDEPAIRAAYHQVSERLREVDGLLGNELLRSSIDTRRFVVASTWADMDKFLAWERSSGHKPATAPLRPFRDTEMPVSFDVYQVEAVYTAERVGA
ncbi:antibiotic biosynthesis monooxygenase [Dactylosporangium fulvum]|uniref:Antibiotic biosynthesis monooxygenase n=1 Tax=Dactylosporangium fulvum TaxID=53359 RepID=A0ABY5W7M3_9ACTN|nr:antibiotic biosynthesis monooxygenase [Dactylosporangium fulvum]UWP86107.1 antibiotic biosynthesis monooxygenase [Dactylosporangium fulvum]